MNPTPVPPVAPARPTPGDAPRMQAGATPLTAEERAGLEEDLAQCIEARFNLGMTPLRTINPTKFAWQAEALDRAIARYRRLLSEDETAVSRTDREVDARETAR